MCRNGVRILPLQRPDISGTGVRMLPKYAKTSQYDGYEFSNIQTEQDIANTIGTTRRVVQRIKEHIMEEFREYWNAEIKPYI
ncbi:MAG: hypothetical protein HPY74_16085 [Firmicutes bacterium]|nr:hypothetical protein [Bacillota bacterium]